MTLDELIARIKLFHFTDNRNLESIQKLGGLYCYPQLIKKGADVVYGGNELSHEADTRFGVDAFVHCCMRDEHPMEYTAKREGRIGETTFLRVNPSILKVEGVRYSFGVANSAGAEIVDLKDALDRIDLDILYTFIPWNTRELYERRQLAERSEILIPDHIPMKYLSANFPNG